MFILLLCLVAISQDIISQNVTNKLDDDRVSYVNTLVGSGQWKKKSTLSGPEYPEGHTYPGVSTPFAMTEWTPQTSMGNVAYWYDGDESAKIQGFRGTHYPSGASIGEYGPVTVMPVVGKLLAYPKERASRYDREGQVAKPHYYRTELKDYGVVAELTATCHTGFMQFTYPQSEEGCLVFDTYHDGGYVEVFPEQGEVVGYSLSVNHSSPEGLAGYFVARVDKEITGFGTYDMNPVMDTALAMSIRTTDDGKPVPGFKAEYFNNIGFEGQPAYSEVCEKIDYDWQRKAPFPQVNADNFSVRYTATIVPKISGCYTFIITSEDGSKVTLDDSVLVNSFECSHPRSKPEDVVSAELLSGKEYHLVIEYYDRRSRAGISFAYLLPGHHRAELHEDASSSDGTDMLGAYIRFATKEGEKVKVKIGTSFISIEQARENMEKEIPGWDFDEVKDAVHDEWNTELRKIDVFGASEKDLRIFYTAMYHCLLLPRTFSEHGIYYSPFDSQIHKGVCYTDFSLWDTFRAEHPLLLLLEPDKVNEMIQSLLNDYDEGGWMPKWPNPGYSNIMMGTHADAVVADAYVKGLRGFDVDKAYEAVMKDAFQQGTGKYVARKGILDYLKLGYVPADKYGESVDRTMEFAYDDFCIAQFAKALGKTDDYESFMKRSKNYMNVLDSETGLARGRNADGSWRSPDDFSISGWSGDTPEMLDVFKWNITLLVPHDPAGLIAFKGGNRRFTAFLDDFFAKDYYYVGDEFSMHAPYLYNYAGESWKTQKTICSLLDYYFEDGPGGLAGNDDCGQLSAWYLFGMMGFYPVAPGIAEYEIGSPHFKKVVVHLADGKSMTIIAKNVSKKNIYVQSVTMNGKPLVGTALNHFELVDNGKVVFRMGDKPCGVSAEEP